MKPIYHAATSLAVSGVLFGIFRSWGLSTASLLSGIFIDIDLVIDYIAQRGLPLKISSFDTSGKRALLKIRLFHCWEWVLLLGIASWLTGWNNWVTGLFIGFGHHIFLDNINYGESVLSYSFIWRWKKGFKYDVIFKRSIEKMISDSH